MTNRLIIDDRHSLDRVAMLALNNANAKATSALDGAGLDQLVDRACYVRGVDRGSSAFLIALDQSAAYENPNFDWFKERYPTFLYIDRIIVADSARGRGIGRLLYEDVFAFALAAGHGRVVCEVNLDPPNPASDGFHAALGFLAVGQAAIHNGAKTVRYFEKPVGTIPGRG